MDFASWFGKLVCRLWTPLTLLWCRRFTTWCSHHLQ